jgi:5-oxoprolinase (ATP-hydrolysing)
LRHDISGGPLAVTDANLILGRLIPEHFPALFGPKGNEPLDPEASSVKFKELAETVELLFILFDN